MVKTKAEQFTEELKLFGIGGECVARLVAPQLPPETINKLSCPEKSLQVKNVNYDQTTKTPRSKR
jgi:hypothetical protein